MKRLLVPGLLVVLAVAGCRQSPSTSTGEKQGDAPKSGDTTPAATKTSVTFSPRTGRVVSSDEVPLLEQINRENTKVMAAVTPGVVRITATRQADPRAKSFSNNLPFQFHFGPGATHNAQQNDPSYGAGIILSKDGYIVTNTHVIEDAHEVEIQLHDKRTFPAHIVAFDAALDIAVLKIEATGLPALSWGDSDKVQVGEQVFAIGNPFNQEGSVSKGIVSATGRSLPDSPGEESYLQIDAPINPGNSGGPVINIHGELIGINTLIASTSGGNEGVGFAIPSNLVRHAVEGLLKETNTVHGYLGVRFPETIDDGVRSLLHLGTHGGALLAGVYPGTPADKAGLHTGDFITEMDGHKINGAVDLRLAVAQTPIGKEVALNYIRDGTAKSTKVKIIEVPKDLQGGGNPSNDASPTSKTGAPDENVLTGLQVSDLDDKSRLQFGIDKIVTAGVVVGNVDYGSTSDLKGVVRGDVLESVSVDHGTTKQLSSAKDFGDVAGNLKSNQSVVLLIHHGKSSSFIFLAPQK